MFLESEWDGDEGSSVTVLIASSSTSSQHQNNLSWFSHPTKYWPWKLKGYNNEILVFDQGLPPLSETFHWLPASYCIKFKFLCLPYKALQCRHKPSCTVQKCQCLLPSSLAQLDTYKYRTSLLTSFHVPCQK